MENKNESIGMTSKEKEVMNHLVDFWNAYLALPNINGVDSSREVCDALHIIQGIMAMRVARRANPEIWR